MNKFKKVLMAGVTAGMLMTAETGMTASTAGWVGAGVSAGGVLLGAAQLFFSGADVVWMPFGNFDAIQLVLEGLVLAQMYNVKDKWDPEPAEEYQKAAENNGGPSGPSGGGGSNSGGVSLDSQTQKLPFAVASLKNVGIEAIGVGPSLGEIATDETRTKILGELEFLQPKSSAKTTQKNENEIPGAGDCSASYSVCLKEMKTTEQEAVVSRQNQNGQNFGTAGIAHAELGLMSVQQAMSNDGNSSVTKQEAGGSSEKAQATLSAGKVQTVQNLKGLIGTGTNTVAAMKIVSLMNLELAQRLNQGNMMQGSVLTVEASRALTDTAGITD